MSVEGIQGERLVTTIVPSIGGAEREGLGIPGAKLDQLRLAGRRSLARGFGALSLVALDADHSNAGIGRSGQRPAELPQPATDVENRAHSRQVNLA